MKSFRILVFLTLCYLAVAGEYCTYWMATFYGQQFIQKAQSTALVLKITISSKGSSNAVSHFMLKKPDAPPQNLFPLFP